MASNIETILKEKFAKAVRALPTILANEAVNFTLDAFKEQGWEGVKWPARSSKSKRKSNAALLVRAGNLRRSVRVISVSGSGFVYGTDIPYARAHNEGSKATVTVGSYTRNRYSKSKQGTGKLTKSGKERMKTVSTISGSVVVKSHSRRMNLPRRQFIGKSNILIQRLTLKGRQYLLKQLNQ